MISLEPLSRTEGKPRRTAVPGLPREAPSRREKLLGTLLENVLEVLLLLDEEGTILYASPSVESVLGHRAEELEGRQAADLVDPSEAALFQAQLRPALADPDTRSPLECRFWHRDGSYRTLEGLCRGITEPPGVVMSVRDVTGSRRTERSLEDSEVRYQTLFDHNPFPMWLYDVRSLAFLAVNEAAVEHYGYSRDEFLRMTLRDIQPPAALAASSEDVAARASRPDDRRPWNRRLSRHCKKDGTVFEVETRATTLRFGDREARLVLAKDVSAERHLEDQLRQAQKMDAIGRLAGGVAHDFNNILFVIGGYAEQLLRRVEQDGALRDKAVGILKATARAASLTRQLLTFSRKEVRQAPVFSLNTVVSDMEKMLGRVIGERVTLSAITAPDLGMVKADPSQMEQVVMNLALNARDAMPEGGRLVIETANVEIDETAASVGLPPGPYVLLSVSDTGTGMDAEVQSHVFEPFFTTKARDRGTGLGLSIVYGIVTQSGGSIEVRSQLGCGSTFNVYLPRVQGAAADTATVAGAETGPGGSETILLVEDDEEVRGITRQVLQEHGYTVLEAVDGPQALALAREQPPDLLLVDMMLPTTTGGELAREVVKAEPGVKVLYTSGYADRTLLTEGRMQSGALFLQKPFTLEMLLRKVRQSLDRRA